MATKFVKQARPCVHGKLITKCNPCRRIKYKIGEQRNQERLRRKLELLRLLGGACVDCGYNGHPQALDFDHQDPTEKTAGVGQLLSNASSWECVLAEAEKCVIRCANCHRIKTDNDRSME